MEVMIAYPAIFLRVKNGIAVTFPDIPEAVTCGYSEGQAMEYAIDALETVLSEYIDRRRNPATDEATFQANSYRRVARNRGSEDRTVPSHESGRHSQGRLGTPDRVAKITSGSAAGPPPFVS